MIEDKLLISRCNRGDREALRSVYEKYRDDLLKLAVALLHDRSSAEDAVNDTFVTFTRSLGKFRLTGKLKSYLCTCLLNRARNMHRDRQRGRPVDLDHAAEVASDRKSPVQMAEFREDRRRLDEAMVQLPYEQREVILLRLVNDLRFREIAATLEISVNTAKSRYRYGLQKLRSQLNGEVTK